jgi:hypothetical protein
VLSSLLIPAALASSASAAAPPPQSATDCAGELKPDPSASPTADEPNLLDYQFHCSTAITAYTIIGNRYSWDDATMDDFSTTANVFDPAGAIVPTQSFGCEGSLPGNGVNCNAGAGGVMTAWDFAKGTIDTTDPYCANIPPGSPPGTQPERQAVVQLVVTDITGAQDGPFTLFMTPQCKPVHVVPKPKPKHKSKHGKASKHGHK